MRKPLHIWLIFLACFALLAAAMAWVGWHTLALEKERETAAHDADQQERVRLALWRLDFQASALMMRENARPPQDFRSFHSPVGLVNKAYDNLAKGEVLVPSSVLAELPEHVLLHFQLDSRGQVTSPQVPKDGERALALAQFVNTDALQRSEQRLKDLRALLAKPAQRADKGAPAPKVSASGQKAPSPAPLLNRQLLAETACVARFEIEEKELNAAANDASLPRNAAWAVQQYEVGQQQLAFNDVESASRNRAVTQQNAAATKQQLNIKLKEAMPEEKPAPSKARQMAAAPAEEKHLAKKLDLDASKVMGSAGMGAGNAATPTAAPPSMAVADAGPAPVTAASAAASVSAAAPLAPAASPAPVPVPASKPVGVSQVITPGEAETLTRTMGTLSAASAPEMPVQPPPPPLALAAPGLVLGPSEMTPPPPPPAVPGSGGVLDDRKANTAAADSSRPFQGVWLEDNLVLTREAVVDGVRMVQGVWLDWPALREAWLREITDLFPAARLDPAANASLSSRPMDDPLRFAALPVRLLPTMAELPPLPFWTPLRKSLGIALACVLLAGAAVGLVLYGTVALSERRAAFVSAVTHELRTPLTTFRLYSEMLADDMVQDPAQRKTYLDTLTGEAGRLSHLVENVLAYARLERGSGKARAETITIGALLDRILPRLKQRADDCAMEVRVHATEADRQTELHIDAAAVEQILFNLVDNACKYAAPRAAQPVIHVEADTTGKFAMLRVRDHGGGISRSERRRIFHPFHKSADQAAHSAPGVGLGLALCRRLAAALGGAITLDPAHKDGACFVLRLPK